MRHSFYRLIAGLATVTFVTPAAGQVPDRPSREQVVHLLNRAAYGPSPGDVDRIIETGINGYLDAQLTPASIADHLTDSILARYEVLDYSRSELAAMDRELQRMVREQRRMAGDDNDMGGGSAEGSITRRRRYARQLRTEFQQLAAVRALTSERQLNEVMVEFWTNHFNIFMAKGIDRFLLPEYIEDVIRPNAMGRFRDLLGATAHSPAMLFYLDNASSVAPGSRPPQLARLERRRAQMIRRGRSTAQLDNRMRNARRNIATGINENYARELMELHTLGVDGGYTQQDVIEVARILTGWSIDRQGGFAFTFNSWAHDDGEKVVMGNAFPAGHGQDEGERLLDFLANHPATRRYVSGKLCAWFVRDDPPEACVVAAAEAWRVSDGDISTVLRAILTSEDFWNPANFGVKTKTPLEFAVSALRAVGARPDSGTVLVQVLTRLGQPPYMYEAPTGYPDDAEAWVNSGSLLQRMNIALAIAGGGPRGFSNALDSLVPAAAEPETMIRRVNELILHGRGSNTTMGVINERTAGIPRRRNARNLAVALALGSPDFQRQ